MTPYLAAILTAAALAPSVPKPFTQLASVEGVTEYALPNGLRVLLVPDDSKPTLTVNVTYFVGSRHEGYGEKGMAHLLEHMLFKGTPRTPDAKKALSEHGAEANGTTWFDRTNYFETVPASDANLEWALKFEADRMVNCFVSKKDLDAEMTVVRNEFEMGENSPQGVLLDRLLSVAYDWHSYGNSTIGPRSDIELVPIERLQAFYRTHYQPDNAVLVVAGKFDTTKVFKLIADTFGKIPKPKRALIGTYTVEPAQDGERSVTIRRVGGSPILATGYHVPAGTHEDFAAVAVLTEILGAAPSGRLYASLVETKQAANVDCTPFQLADPGYLVCLVELGAKDSPENARKLLTETIEKFASKPPSAADVTRAKTHLLKNFELVFNSTQRIGITLSDWAAMGDWRMLYLHRDRLKAVTPEQVLEAARKYLKTSNRTLGEYVPTEKPDRTEVPSRPDVAALVKDYKGAEAMAAGEAFDASPGNIESRTRRSVLKNGLKLALLQKSTRGQTVHVAANFRYGSEKSLAANRTVAELVASMLKRGTTKHTRQEFGDALAELNAELHFAPGNGGITVALEVRRPQLAAALDLLAEALQSPKFDPKELETLRREQLAALEEKKTEPTAVAAVELRRALGGWPKTHPLYVPSVEEHMAEVTSTSLEALKAFHASHYGAQAAQVAVVGDFEPEEVQKKLAALFETFVAKTPFERIPEPHRPIEVASKVILTPDKANAFLGLGLKFPLKDSDPEYPAMLLGDYMLGGGFLSGRVPQRLREKDGLSYGAATFFRAQAQDDGAALGGYAIFAPQNLAKVEAGFKEELARALKDGFTKDEVEKARSGLLKERHQSRSNDGELAGLISNQLFIDRTMKFSEALDQKLAELTPEAVVAALRKNLDLNKMFVVKAGDFEPKKK